VKVPTNEEVDRMIARLEESTTQSITAGSVPVKLAITKPECKHLARLCDPSWLSSMEHTQFGQTTAYRQLQRDQQALRAERELYLADMSHPKWDKPLTRNQSWLGLVLIIISGISAIALILQVVYHGR
jgi:hypothetical protein